MYMVVLSYWLNMWQKFWMYTNEEMKYIAFLEVLKNNLLEWKRETFLKNGAIWEIDL